MRKKKSNTKILSSILIAGIIIGILILITIISIIIFKTKENEKTDNNVISNSINETNSAEKDEEYEETIKKVNEGYLEKGEIVPENYNFLVRLYDGVVDDTELYSKLYKVIYQNIPELIDNLYGKSENEIIEFFNVNKQNVYETFGIDNSEEFIKLINKISNVKDLEYSSSTLDVENLQDDNEYTTVDLKVKYSTGKEITLVLKLKDDDVIKGSNIIIH